MTAKTYRRAGTAAAGLAIAALLSVLVVVWVLQTGRTSTETMSTSSPPTTTPSPSDSPTIPAAIVERRRQHNRQTKPPDSTLIDGHTKTTAARESKVLEKSHLDEDLGPLSRTEYVKPMKVGPAPLHDHDIIYDQLHDSGGRHPPLRHHSGHFRHKSAEVWDPHPHYEIEAFGKRLYLELTYNDAFVSPKFHVTRTWPNFTQRENHEPTILGCYYTGKVKGEQSSDVSVSLCNGMTGYIRTAHDNYFIEPAEKFSENSVSSILHRIVMTSRLRQEDDENKAILSNDIVSSGEEGCEIRESVYTKKASSPGEVRRGNEERHVLSRRSLKSVDYPEEMYEEPTGGESSWEEGTFEFSPARRKNVNQEYHIETMIVADKKMAEYHGNPDDLIHYILTLMSHVSLLYKDVTIGNPISLAVVKIVILDDEDFASTTSEEMLRKFCEYQARKHRRGAHDIALLLTRGNICKNSTALQCNTLGVAEVGAMCNPNSSCAIVKDKGLSTSYTISHELGHALSMPHDDDRRCMSFNGGIEENNVMSKVLQNDTKPWFWSACSKHFLTDFLESHRAFCLLDEPHDNQLPKNGAVLPGETFEVDRQCELEFGEEYKLCPYNEIPPCASLWCTTKGMPVQGCRSQHMPWADGTLCAENSWCHRGECVALDRELLRPVGGRWGDWRPWESCSRTCGGGVQISKRACDSPPPSNGGAYCIGRSVRYRSCNVQPCEANHPNFREVQCGEFNGVTRGIPGLSSDVKWVPKYGLENPDDLCKLYCRVKNSNSYYLLKDKVIDGTKCALNSFGICVSGICRPGGCDNKLGSKASLDECGVCNGDNSECTEISESYNVSGVYGYTNVAKIPKGSSNIYVQQHGYMNNSIEDTSYIALLDEETGEYILNGNFMVSAFLKEVVFGGLTITYSGAEEVNENIRTPRNRQIKKNLILQVLSVGKTVPPDITYRYTIKRKETDNRFAWQIRTQRWSECTSPCSGKQHIWPVCVDLGTLNVINDSYCSTERSRSVQTRDCNTNCRFEWRVATRGTCSAHCGKGIRRVFHKCEEMTLASSEKSRLRTKFVDEKYCGRLNAPPETEECDGSCESTRWDYDEWSGCSQTCGGGVQTRSAKCIDTNGRQIDESMCNRAERDEQQVCNSQKCPVWAFQEWTPCSVTCGKGFRTRPYLCHVDGQKYPTDKCDPEKLKSISEECNNGPCVSWNVTGWSDCNAKTCDGEGVQERAVTCIVDSVVQDDYYCHDKLKPNATKTCFANRCEKITAAYSNDINNPSIYVSTHRYSAGRHLEDNRITAHGGSYYKYDWVTGVWSNCSKNCGNGTQSRMVVCRNEMGDENEYKCDLSQKPVHSSPCNENPCPSWNFGDWSVCDSDCVQRRQVSCQMKATIVEDSRCDTKFKPTTSQKCKHCRLRSNRNQIVGEKSRNYNAKENRNQYTWNYGKWGRCSNSCGRGNKTRDVTCIDKQLNVSMVDQYCRNLKKPRTEKHCQKFKCNYIWVEGQWSECSATCGLGTKTRNVKCHKVLGNGYYHPTPLPHVSYKNFGSARNYCDLASTPPTQVHCNEHDCDDPYYWRASPWSECSHPCGRKGHQTRTVRCVDRYGSAVRPQMCSKGVRKIKRRQKCNQHRCIYRSCKEVKERLRTNENGDRSLLVNERSARVYCYKMDTSEPEEFITLNADVQNYAEFFDMRSRQIHVCSKNQPLENCDCDQLNPEDYGYTVFWKVRLNITSMRILGDDYTFSKQEHGKLQMPYGTSGDCFSKRASDGCTQGYFSIDLSKTSFRLSQQNRWITQGDLANQDVFVMPDGRVARGRCGGYCGRCEPDPQYGLAVEVT